MRFDDDLMGFLLDFMGFNGMRSDFNGIFHGIS
jgi:hypothetical protein